MACEERSVESEVVYHPPHNARSRWKEADGYCSLQISPPNDGQREPEQRLHSRGSSVWESGGYGSEGNALKCMLTADCRQNSDSVTHADTPSHRSQLHSLTSTRFFCGAISPLASDSAMSLPVVQPASSTSSSSAPTLDARLLRLHSAFAHLDSISPDHPASQSITLPKLKEALTVYSNHTFTPLPNPATHSARHWPTSDAAA